MKKPARPKENKREVPLRTCRECGHSYDWHSRALDGHLILCRYPFKMDGGKYCIFLRDPECENFTPRIENAETKE